MHGENVNSTYVQHHGLCQIRLLYELLVDYLAVSLDGEPCLSAVTLLVPRAYDEGYLVESLLEPEVGETAADALSQFLACAEGYSGVVLVAVDAHVLPLFDTAPLVLGDRYGPAPVTDKMWRDILYQVDLVLGYEIGLWPGREYRGLPFLPELDVPEIDTLQAGPVFEAEYVHAAYVQDVFSGGVPAAHHLVDQIPPIRLHQHDICSGVVCSETVRLRTVALAWAHYETDFIILAFEGEYCICIFLGLVVEDAVPKRESVRVRMDGDVEGLPILIIVYLRLVLSRLDGLEAADEFYLRLCIKGKKDCQYE